jgi:hypothetical protein
VKAPAIEEIYFMALAHALRHGFAEELMGSAEMARWLTPMAGMVAARQVWDNQKEAIILTIDRLDEGSPMGRIYRNFLRRRGFQ